MKLHKFVKTIPTLSVMLSAAMLTLAIAGCGNVTDPTSGSTTSTFTVTPGAKIERSVSGSGKISFTVKGIDMDLDKDKQPIVFFYDSKGYGSGRATGGFNGEVRNYKLKYYGTNGKNASETRHGTQFKSDQSYDVVLEWQTGGAGYMKVTINGLALQKPGGVAENFTLGIGYSPTVPGWDGAVYTKIVRPSGSTEIK